MAARSPAPAKRCDRPQSLSASAAGRRRASISANISIAAESRAEGVMTNISAPISAASRLRYTSALQRTTSRQRQDLDNINGPHHRKHHRGDSKQRTAQPHDIARDVHIGVRNTEQHKDPGQYHKHNAGKVRDMFENG